MEEWVISSIPLDPDSCRTSGHSAALVRDTIFFGDLCVGSRIASIVASLHAELTNLEIRQHKVREGLSPPATPRASVSGNWPISRPKPRPRASVLQWIATLAGKRIRESSPTVTGPGQGRVHDAGLGGKHASLSWTRPEQDHSSRPRSEPVDLGCILIAFTHDSPSAGTLTPPATCCAPG